MPVTSGPGLQEGLQGGPREQASRRNEDRRDQLALLAELREVEHWRRLVAARLDLAVAAVAAVDEPVVRDLAPAPGPPCGLRELLGLDAPGGHHGPGGAPGGDASLLLRLRDAQRDLDAYARALRARTRTATSGLVSRLDDRRPGAGPGPSPDGDELAPVLPLPLPRPRRGPDDVA